MSVKKRGSFASIRRDARRAQEQGIRAFTREYHTNVVRETPKRSRELSRHWRMKVKGMVGIVGNTLDYAPTVALWPKTRTPTATERSEHGFHERAAKRPLRRLDRLFRGAFQRVFG